ncbi:MAG: hypothetical protein JW806_04100 [Sedimentisphaerales bacterium]|nr:hypothetical protein [Sedimentisphaerales bacterium]
MKMKLPEEFWQLQWYILFAGLSLAALLFGVLAGPVPAFRWIFLILLYMAGTVAVFSIIFLLSEAVRIIKYQQEKTEEVGESIIANKSLLEQIGQGVRLSEAAKEILYRDMDRQQLKASVLEKLHQQDFDGTFAMIDDIAEKSEYKELAEELKVTANRYRDATEQERINHVISYIEKLLEQHQWSTASVQIERLVQKYPDSESAKSMKGRLVEKREERKRELLTTWDEAVKKADTDYSLRILKELDKYLTASEGLALQEAASEVFKNKLHNLGVQFALVVSDKQWSKALETGKEIIRDFPNSRIADEIRGKLSILEERAKEN